MKANMEAFSKLVRNATEIPAVVRWFNATVPDFSSDKELSSGEHTFDRNTLYDAAVKNELCLLPSDLSVSSVEIALRTHKWHEKYIEALQSLHILPLVFATRCAGLRVELAVRGWRDLEFLPFTHRDLHDILSKLRGEEKIEKQIPNKQLTDIILNDSLFEATCEEEMQLVGAASYWGVHKYLESIDMEFEDPVDVSSTPNYIIERGLTALHYSMLADRPKTTSFILDKWEHVFVLPNWSSLETEKLYRMLDEALLASDRCFDILYRLLITYDIFTYTWGQCIESGLQNLANTLLKRHSMGLRVMKEVATNRLPDSVIDRLMKGEPDEGALIFAHYRVDREYHDGDCSDGDDEIEYLCRQNRVLYAEKYRSDNVIDYKEVFVEAEACSWHKPCFSESRSPGKPPYYARVCDSELYKYQNSIIFPFHLLSDSCIDAKRNYNA